MNAPTEVIADRDGFVAVTHGTSSLLIDPAALQLRGTTLWIKGNRATGRRSGRWHDVGAKAAGELRLAGVEERHPPARSAAGWYRGVFEIAGNHGPRKVYGWRWGGWGIALHFADADGAALVETGRAAGPEPPRTLTHLRSGLSTRAGSRAISNLKRLAVELGEAVPTLATTEAADFSPEQKAAARAVLARAA